MPLEERSLMDVREQMALAALDERYTVSEVAEMFGVARPTVRLWRDRYRSGGRAGLEDRSHAPRCCPHRTAPELEALVIAERKQWGWGSKKILQRLEEAHRGVALPKRATVDAILARHGLIQQQRHRRRREGRGPFCRRYEATRPGELTTIDFKGQFRLRNGRYCFPLTLADSFSRYLLACEALAGTSLEGVWPVVVRVFRECGLPHAMQSDNGPPFGPTHGRFSTMSVRLMMLDIQPVFSRPARPSDNGRHERMHRELKAEATRPASASFADQQRRFDRFRSIYNTERPHEGLGMQRPARIYTGSQRPYPSKPARPNYPLHFEKRRVGSAGCISWQGHPIFISEAFHGQTLGLEPIEDHLWRVHFYRFVIGKFDSAAKEFL